MATTEKKSVYEVLSSVDVSKMTEKKNGLTYLSWAHAWGTLLKHYPLSDYTVYENELGYNYFTDGNTCWVKTGVTVEGKERIEYLPVMDFRNKSIPSDKVTSFDVNSSIQRSLTKAIARHGLGLNVYAGEDLPMSDIESKDDSAKPSTKVQTASKPQAPLPYLNKDTKEWTTVSTAVKDGKVNMEYVESKFRLSKPVKEELTSLLPKKG